MDHLLQQQVQLYFLVTLKLFIISDRYLFLFHRGIEGVCRTLLSANVTWTPGVERVVHHSVPGILGEVRGDVEVTLPLVPGARLSEGKKTEMKSLTLQCTGFPDLEMKWSHLCIAWPKKSLGFQQNRRKCFDHPGNIQINVDSIKIGQNSLLSDKSMEISPEVAPPPVRAESGWRSWRDRQKMPARESETNVLLKGIEWLLMVIPRKWILFYFSENDEIF